MRKTIQISAFLAFILLISCGKSEQQIEQEKEAIAKQKKEQIQIRNEKAIINLCEKYNAVSGWDTLNLYTYHYQELFIDQKRPISFKGELNDITKTDSTYFLRVRNTNWRYSKDYIAQISLNHQTFNKFQSILKLKNHTNKGCFIFSVSKILSVSPKLISEAESDSENYYSYLDFDFDETLLIFKGELIDFYLIEILPKSDE